MSPLITKLCCEVLPLVRALNLADLSAMWDICGDTFIFVQSTILERTCRRCPAACRYRAQHIWGIASGICFSRSAKAPVVRSPRSRYLNTRTELTERVLREHEQPNIHSRTILQLSPAPSQGALTCQHPWRPPIGPLLHEGSRAACVPNTPHKRHTWVWFAKHYADREGSVVTARHGRMLANTSRM